jgi:predicted lipoprotein with Yx(FWY)xxD motif
MRVVRTRRALLLAGPAALVLTAAVACSSSSSPVSTSTSSSSSPMATSSGTSGSTSADALAVTANSTLGQIVTTGSGRTVYRFDLDTANPPKSNCSGSCATYWPPVLVTGSAMPAVSGVSSSLLGEVTRSDGSKQLTLAGWPLYTYAGDSGPGMASGQGVNASGAKWWAVTPTGAKASGSGAGGSSSSSSGSGSGGGNY